MPWQGEEREEKGRRVKRRRYSCLGRTHSRMIFPLTTADILDAYLPTIRRFPEAHGLACFFALITPLTIVGSRGWNAEKKKVRFL